MTAPREGFHNFLVQLPDVIWQRLCAEVEGDPSMSVSGLVSRILAKNFRIPLGELPKPKRAGRKPKRAGRKPKS